MARFFSGMQRRSFRRSGGGKTQGGVPTLLLETTGARSGEMRSAMLGFLEDGRGGWLIVASLAGSARNPAWLHNLAKHPAATIELPGGRRVRVSATSLEGQELQAAWQRFSTDAPEYAEYLSVTDRAMAIVRLREVEGASRG
jgi:deazaflavin-dependent oxidoreductase (nitroreductase family)